MAHTGLAVVEARWGSRSNVSVRYLFDTMANIFEGNPNEYYYEMFNSRAAFRRAALAIGQINTVQYLYVACHGDLGEIAGGVNAVDLRDVLVSSDIFVPRTGDVQD